MQRESDIRAFNRACREIGDPEKQTSLDVLNYERRAAQAINRYARVKLLDWQGTGYTLPDGSIPANLAREYMMIETVFREEQQK